MVENSIYLICEYYQIIVFICFINLFDKWIVSIYYSYMHYQLYIWIQFFMEILSITYARVLYLVPFKIPKLYKIPHSRCMLRQFETRSSVRPTAAACASTRKKHYHATAINTARITVPKRILAQTMIPNPQGSRQTKGLHLASA